MFSVIVLGITSIVFQLVFFREFLTTVSSNELTLCLLLFNWLLLNGLGTLLGGKLKKKTGLLPALHFLAILFPVLTLTLLRLSKNLLFTRGAELNILPFFLYSFILLSPFCLINSIFLPIAYEKSIQQRERMSVYIADNIGDLLGGLLFTLLFVFISDPYAIFTMTGLLNGYALYRFKRQTLVYGLLVIVLFILPFTGINKRTTSYLFKGLDLERQISSKYGLIRFFKSDRDHVVMENSEIISYSDNMTLREELVHIPLVQIHRKDKILVVSGGLSGILDEVRKHHPEKIDYVELNPKLIKVGLENNLIKKAGNLNLITQDGRKYIEHTKEQYNGIILSLPLPNSLGHNRFYTHEFFRAVKAILKPGGVIAFQLPAVPDYLSQEMESLFSIVKATLGKHFKEVLFFPGHHTIAVASDEKINRNLGPLIKEMNINNRFLNEHYIQGTFTPFRFDMVNRIHTAEKNNRDFQPSLFLAFQTLFFKEFGFKAFYLLVPLMLVLLFFLFTPGKRPFIIFTTGFSVTGAEIFLITAFEIYFGTLYFALSFLFTLFLFGLCIGFYFGEKQGRGKVVVTEMAIILFLLLSLLVTLPFAKHLIPLIIIGIALGSGYQFAILLKSRGGEFANLFGADFLGGALGSLVMGTFLFPVLGPFFAVLTLVILKFISLYIAVKV
jgi:spermidine synthase